MRQGGAVIALALMVVLSIAVTGAADERPSKIISMAPSITETLFALGLGGRVIGVTRFCKYPAEAKQKRDVGGFFDPNYELIFSLRPDLVVLLETHREAKVNLHKLGIKTLSVDHDSIDGIIESIRLIGARAGVAGRAEKLLSDIKLRLTEVDAKVKNLNRPKVLISVSRDVGSGGIRRITVAGEKSFYNDIIKLAGGRNAYDGGGIAYPKVSAEGLIRMKPDYILDIIPTFKQTGVSLESARNEWRRVVSKKIMTSGAIHILWQDYAVIPGPRFVKIVERITRVIHPELAWDR